MTNTIETVENGYIFTQGDTWGNNRRFVATTLTELAKVAEPDTFPRDASNTAISYKADYGKSSVEAARWEVRNGNKITAIKILRECYNYRLGLREAKDLVEVMAGL